MSRCRLVCSIATLAVIVACNRDDAPLRRADGSMFSSSGGDVQLTDGSHVQVTITSERYKQWEAARSGLRRNVIARFGKLLHPEAPTQASIDRAIAFLETDVASRESIEGSGMTVRDFVLMTVALEQEMRLASRAGTPAPAPQPMPYPVDTVTPTPASAYADSIMMESTRAATRDSVRRFNDVRRADSLRRADSVSIARRIDSLARHRIDSLERARSDSATHKSDSVSRPPRDSVRDTLSPRPPPDSLPRT